MSTIVLNAKVVRKTIAVQSKVGVPGQTGAAGPAGADGDDGLSAYQVAVAGGFVGTEAQWLASLVGATGPQGIQGVQGPIGIQGPAGEAGATGATGSAGHSPVVIFGSGADADRLTIDGVASGPHLTGPQGATGAPGTTDHSALANLSADTHAQYHTDARGDARYSPLGHSHPGAYDPSGTAAAAVSAHVAAGDPHPGYLTPAEGNAAYEPINANIQAHIASAANPHGVTAAQAGADPAGTASSAIASHLAAGDPHPAYTTAAEAASAAPVQSVAGKTGAVSLAIADTSGLQTALDGKSATGHSHSGLLPAGGTTGQVLTKASATDYDTAWVTGGGGGGVTDHGALTGLSNDTHAQYHTDARGDARYARLIPNQIAIAQPFQLSGVYGCASTNATALSTVGGTAGRLDLSPVFFAQTTQVDRLAIYVAGAAPGGLTRVAIYLSDSSGLPSTLFFYQTTPFDMSSTGVKEETVSFAFAANTMYWVGLHFSTTATVRAIQVGGLPSLGFLAAGLSGTTHATVFRRSASYPTPPDPFNPVSSELVNTQAPAIFWRIA